MISLIVKFVIVSIALLLHVFGIYVLHLAKHSALQNTQRLYFLNLSISEVFILVAALIRTTEYLFEKNDFFLYVRLTQQGFGFPVYYLIMISLTLDRFFSVYLNIRYPLFWSEKRTKCMLLGIYCTGIIIMCVFMTVKPSVHFLFSYFFITWGYVCILTAALTYSYITYKVVKNKKQQKRRIGSLSMKPGRESSNSRSKIKKRSPRPSGLYSVMFLVLTFFVLIMIPDQIYSYYGRNQMAIPMNIKVLLDAMYFTAFASDFFAYTFSSKPIRKIAIRTLRCHKVAA